MKRRSFLQLLGLAPAAPLITKLPAAPVAAPIIERVISTPGPEPINLCYSVSSCPFGDTHTITDL
jgi:hypothetical protein